MAALDDARNLQNELAALLASVGLVPGADDTPAPVSAVGELDEPEPPALEPEMDPAGVTVKVRFLNPAGRGDDDVQDLAEAGDRWAMRAALAGLLDKHADAVRAFQHFAQVDVVGGGADHDQIVVDLLVEAINKGLVVLPMHKDRTLWRAATVQYTNEYAGAGRAGAEEAKARRNRWVATVRALHGND